MKYDEFAEFEVSNMRVTALNAIDMLQAIVAECNSDYVSRRYLKEKADKAKWLVDFIYEAVNRRAE